MKGATLATLSGIVVAVVLFPASGGSQTLAHSSSETLQRQARERGVATNTLGRKPRGAIEEVSTPWPVPESIPSTDVLGRRPLRETTATSFDELQHILKLGQMVVVTETNGRRTKGKVASLSRFWLTISTSDRTIRTFAESAVTEIRTPTDPWWDGALAGAAVGALAGAEAGMGGELGIETLFATGVFAAVFAAGGAGVDALMKDGGKVLYRSPGQNTGETGSPLPGNDRQATRAK